MLFQTKKKHRKTIEERFGKTPSDWDQERAKNRLDRIAVYHKEIETKDRGFFVDTVTWNDLQMDEVFLRINHTGSYIGEQTLYHQLHKINPDESGWDNLEKQIRFYCENPGERIKIEESLQQIGKGDGDYYMPQFLMHTELWRVQKGYLLHLLQLLLLGFLAGFIFTGEAIYVTGLILAAAVNLAVYTVIRQKYEIFLYSLGSLKYMLLFCQKMISGPYKDALSVPEEIIQTAEELKGLSKKIIGWQTRKAAALTGDFMYLLQDYLFGVTLLDISVFNHMMKMIYSRQEQVMMLYAFAGQIDMGISVASFRESLSYYCLPESGGQPDLSVRALVHPLLKKPVANDFTLDHRALITGANASGKSTFMKALAINAILAQTIHTCTAQSFCLPAVRVITSMSLRDDVLTGESYYVREAKRIREMLEPENAACPKLLVIDEILKGTNTTERLAASAAILDYFAETSAFILVATHDMELVYDMGEKYENYYFESAITDTDIVFTYKIHKGRGGNSNAIGLLTLLDYPQSIIVSAKKRMETGI